MKQVALLLLLAACAPLGYAAKAEYQPGKIVAVDEKTSTRVLYYLVNTPVTKDETYYEISVQVKDQILTGKYTPRHSADIPPPQWIPGADVKVRLSEKHMLLQPPEGGPDLDVAIAKRKPVEAGPSVSTPSPPQK